MRTGVSFTVGSEDRCRLEAIVTDRNAKQKHVWRAILESGDGSGTMEICAGPASRRPVSGAGSSAAWRRVSTVSCMTRRSRPERRRLRRGRCARSWN